jgi:hypothetical protein
MIDNQCGGSRMCIPDPDFYPSRIPDQKTATKERGENNGFGIRDPEKTYSGSATQVQL